MKTKAKGKLLAILMSLAVVFTMTPVISQPAHAWSYATVGYLEYVLEDDGTATVSGHTDKMPADVTVPAEIVSGGETYQVVSVMGLADCANLESVTIPKSVTSIGRGAFQNSGLTSVTFESGSTLTEIGMSAFQDCASLTSIMIPNSVTSIGRGAFQNSGLTSVTFENGSIIEEIGNAAFQDCASLTSITIPNSVTGIGNAAFQDCTNLGTITIPKSVTGIGVSAFLNTGLTSVVIPSGVTTIGWGAFGDCNSLSTVYYVGTKDQWDNMTGRDDYWTGGRVVNVVFVDKAADVPTGKTFIYNGHEQTGVDDGEGYTLSDGVVKATNVGTYTVTAAKQAGYEVWRDGTTTDTRTVTWEIRKAIADDRVAIPESRNFTYNGKTQTGVAAGTGYTLSGTASAVKAGTYKATATLNEHPNPNYMYAWADGSTDPIEIEWKIDKAIAEDKVAIPVSRNFTYNGKVQTGVSEGANYTLSGTTKATKAGTYTAKATLNDDDNYIYKWSDGTTASKNITWKINKATVKVTVPKGKTFTYNGKTKTGVAAGANYTLSGTVTATKAGTFTAKTTLKTNANYIYKWADGTTAAKSIKWKINKAANPLTIKARTATVKYTAAKKKAQVIGVTKVIAFTKKGQGKMTYTKVSGNMSITIAKTTGKVTVKKGLKKGTYSIKVKVKAAGNTNYKASAWKTVTFKVKVN